MTDPLSDPVLISALRKLAALAINHMCGAPVFHKQVSGDQLREAAIREGLFVLDDLHHAPACPANHWHKKRLPTGRCTCGAARKTSALEAQNDE